MKESTTAKIDGLRTTSYMGGNSSTSLSAEVQYFHEKVSSTLIGVVVVEGG
jgi:hypothetical protein